MRRRISLVVTPTSVELIPRDVLFGNPTRVSPAISPDGKRLGYIAPHEGVLNVWVRTIGQEDDRVVTSAKERPIRQFAWAHNDRHLLYVQDKGGDENWRLYSVDLDSGEERDLTPFDDVQVGQLFANRDFPDEVLVAMNKDNPQLHDIWHVDLRTGELTKRVENPGFIAWVADKQFRIRCAAAPTPEGGMVVVVREDEDSPWQPVLQADMEDALTSGPVGFSADGNTLFLQSSVGAETGRLVARDLTTGEERVVAEDPAADVSDVTVHPETREIQIVTFQKERLEHVVLDPDIEADWRAVESLEPGDANFLGRDRADRTWLVAFTADDGPVRYYAWDRNAKQATFLFEHRPELNDYTLASMEPFSFTARDGLEIHGYLTFPAGVERSNLPTVLNVHGGPWARDTWGFNSEAQWFANRGYLCVQVNYRGSTGYGKAFINAGNREWAGKMHDDLIDAIDYLVAQGWTDREKVGIYGGSYGGYAALVGATFTPDVFRCAVDIVGPSNIATLINSIPEYWKPMIAQFHQRVGNPETEAEFLWSRSPLSRVDQIKIPMLIAQGANDPRVKQDESEQIVSAMQEKGITHEYMLFEDEGHGFAKPENRMRFYAAAERFLADHLGGRCEEAPTDLSA